MTWMRTPRRARSIATTSASTALVYATITSSMSCSATRRGSSASSPERGRRARLAARGAHRRESRRPRMRTHGGAGRAPTRGAQSSLFPRRASLPDGGVPRRRRACGPPTHAEVKPREAITSRPASRVPSKPPETSAVMTAADQPRRTSWPEVRRRAPGTRVTGSYARAAPRSRIVRRPVNTKPASACQDIRAATGPAPPSRMSDRKPKVANDVERDECGSYLVGATIVRPPLSGRGALCDRRCALDGDGIHAAASHGKRPSEERWPHSERNSRRSALASDDSRVSTSATAAESILASPCRRMVSRGGS